MEKLALPPEAIPVKQFLADHADFHKLLLDDLYDAVYFVDPERRILYWNHSAEALSGFSPGPGYRTAWPPWQPRRATRPPSAISR